MNAGELLGNLYKQQLADAMEQRIIYEAKFLIAQDEIQQLNKKVAQLEKQVEESHKNAAEAED